MEHNIDCPDWLHLARLEAQGQKLVPDTKKRLYINAEKNSAICFRCGFKTRNAAELIAKLNLRLAVNSAYVSPTSTPTLELPPEYQGVFKRSAMGLRAWSYLTKDRLLSPTVICSYELGFCVGGDYGGRIIIPIYLKGALVNFQARDFLERKELPRYISARKDQGANGDAFFNFDRASQQGLCVLTEGPFDALRIPEFAIAMLGSTKWNERRRNLLLSASFHTILLALDDDDAGHHAGETIRHSLGGFSTLQITNLRVPGNDLGGLDPDTTNRVRQLCRALNVGGTLHPETIELGYSI